MHSEGAKHVWCQAVERAIFLAELIVRTAGADTEGVMLKSHNVR